MRWQVARLRGPAISGPSVLRAPQDAFWLAVFSPFPALGACGVADGACPIASATVSYTHLDVYKRQTLIPGVDAEGKATPPLSFFHAFYFISYTATTIGFGEVPNAFSDAQRMWVTVSIYLTVVGYSYSFFTLFALLQDKGFQNTLTTNRFSRRVRLLKEPFYLVCGCGETGNLICKTLDRTGRAFVCLLYTSRCV